MPTAKDPLAFSAWSRPVTLRHAGRLKHNRAEQVAARPPRVRGTIVFPSNPMVRRDCLNHRCAPLGKRQELPSRAASLLLTSDHLGRKRNCWRQSCWPERNRSTAGRQRKACDGLFELPGGSPVPHACCCSPACCVGSCRTVSASTKAQRLCVTPDTARDSLPDPATRGVPQGWSAYPLERLANGMSLMDSLARTPVAIGVARNLELSRTYID